MDGAPAWPGIVTATSRSPARLGSCATSSQDLALHIPPGAADTVHYRMRIPENAGNKITLHARMLYRKFAWWNTQFAFAGVPDPTSKAGVSRSFDDRPFEFNRYFGGG